MKGERAGERVHVVRSSVKSSCEHQEYAKRCVKVSYSLPQISRQPIEIVERLGESKEERRRAATDIQFFERALSDSRYCHHVKR